MKFISVLVVDQSIENKGILTNAGFVLGLSAGRYLPADTFGSDVVDGDGSTHGALTNIAHFVRKSGQSKLRTLRAEFINHPDVKIIDYTEDAAPSNYETYAANIATHKGDEITYRAVHFFGPEEVLIPKTKNLSSLS